MWAYHLPRGIHIFTKNKTKLKSWQKVAFKKTNKLPKRNGAVSLKRLPPHKTQQNLLPIHRAGWSLAFGQTVAIKTLGCYTKWSCANFRQEDNWLLLRFHSGSSCLWPCRCSLCFPISRSSCKTTGRTKGQEMTDASRFRSCKLMLTETKTKTVSAIRSSLYDKSFNLSIAFTDLFFTIQYFLPSTSSPSKP